MLTFEINTSSICAMFLHSGVSELAIVERSPVLQFAMHAVEVRVQFQLHSQFMLLDTHSMCCIFVISQNNSTNEREEPTARYR